MRIYKLLLVVVLAFAVGGTVFARHPDNYRKSATTTKVKYRDVCANSTSSIDQQINNVRARLLGGGDCWWNFSDGRYIVPKVDLSSGQQEVSSMYAGAVWIGGYDDFDNLKLACQDYRSSTANDFWPGPLDPIQGNTDAVTCENWDRHFRVTGDDIRLHLRNLAAGKDSPSDIPRGLREWPAKGNPYFVDVWGFDLPFTNQALAGFYDADEDGLYDPLKGDYPSIDIRGCPNDRYPDEMIFWIYNDEGGGQEHTQSKGRAIRMEVQVQAFGYATNDALNDMTFQRYKLINRATDPIDSTFFAMWVDPDLGCSIDDYIGCDTALSLMYVYNQDPVDGQPGNSCAGVPTYNDKVPMIGVDYFRGPLRPITADSSVELGMSSFMYYNRGGADGGNWPAAMVDPDQPQSFYNYITGSWSDGTPCTYGGTGYNPNNPTAGNIDYVFTEQPNLPAPAWSMCTANLSFGDRRTLQASGPFRLNPGAVNELIIGVPWVADITYPCPDMEPLFRADRLAQGLFDNCFDLLDGPDAPTVNWIELDREVIAVLTNDSLSLNFKEDYSEVDFLAPDSLRNSPDPAEREATKYRFEGYKIYQLLNPNTSNADFENPDRSRLVYQVDVKNGVKKIYNWEEGNNPNSPGEKIYTPTVQVEGLDGGVRHTFSIKEDKFATGNDKRLVNHKKYYFVAVAYAYNNYGVFDPNTGAGQPKPYLVGRKASDGPIQVFTVVPRPIVDQVLQSSYGDGVAVSRLEGVGAGGNFLDLDDETRARLLTPGFDSILGYKAGRSPINITIFNPFEVKEGDFELSLVDGNLNDAVLDDTAHWELRSIQDGTLISSEKSIAQINEQIVPQYGFSVSIAQTLDAGDNNDPTNGGIGSEVEYKDINIPWLTGYKEQDLAPFHYVLTKPPMERDYELDISRGLSILGNGWFVPYVLADWRLGDRAPTANDRVITPAWTEKGYTLNASVLGSDVDRKLKLSQLPNVDIVLTSDTSKWSRCMVVESASYYYSDGNDFPKLDGLETESPANRDRLMFDVRYAPSVGKSDSNGDGLPDPDGAVNPPGVPNNQAGTPVRGMGWFPGYAVDVETGQRLNVFFGENSVYNSAIDPKWTGRDMLWNPTDQIIRDENQLEDYYDLILGGQHWVYVTSTRYDGCEAMRRRLTPEFSPSVQATGVFKVQRMKDIAWAGMLQVAPGFKMKTLREGLIPNDAIIKLRVDNPYQTWYSDANGNQKTGHPKYRFSTRTQQPTRLDQVQVGNALDSIKVVPNPYYGFSQYETSQYSNVIKITNLPGKCTVTIYSLDGKFIRKYERNEVYQPYQQITPDLEWDLKNSKGIPVASGVYLINIQARELNTDDVGSSGGTRTIKWFGIARQFDPSGL
ncbi:MAG TPA: hypothetical protein PLO67_18485 [Saprospiraceae bacterium]|nr:hypothetical protein [Saprospiraceae bacterium]HPI08161.1 hypothetical protein [Saprospiraceae bacterium]